MAFDPDAFIASNAPKFDPDAFIASHDDSFATQAAQYAPDTMSADEEAAAANQLGPQLGEAVMSQVRPFIQHPLEAAYNTIVPNRRDLNAILALAKSDTYKQNLKPGSQEWLNQVVGNAIPLALLGAGKLLGGGVETPAETPELAPARPVSASEAAPSVKTPDVAQNATAGGVAPIAARVQPKPELTPEQADAVNAELAQRGEPAPEAPQPAQNFDEVLSDWENGLEPYSGAPAEAPAVRQPLTLDELRLMRERSDLQLQNELARRVGGATHPAIDARISQINGELDNIANDALQPNFEPVPEGVNDAIGQIEDARLARAQEDARLQPEDESRPSDEAVTGAASGNEAVGEPAGQQQAVSQQPVGVGTSTAPRASAAPGISTRNAYTEARRADFGLEDRAQPDTRYWGQVSAQADRILTKNPGEAARLAEQVGRDKKPSGRYSLDLQDELLARHQANAERAFLDAGASDPQAAQRVHEAFKASEALGTEYGRGLAHRNADVPLPDLTDPKAFDVALARKTGRTATPAERSQFQSASGRLREAQDNALKAADAARNDVRSRAAGKTMTLDELRNAAEQFVKSKLADCVV